MESEQSNESGKLIVDIKKHVLQVETMLLYIVLFQVLLSLQPVVADFVHPEVAYVLPFAMLALLPLVMRVTNPEYTLRAIFKGATAGLGTGGTIGTVTAGTLTGGLAAPAGGLVGAAIGSVVGAVLGPWLDSNSKPVLTQGEAREWLMARRKKRCPDLSDEMIIEATQHPPRNNSCHVFMFVSDGAIKCSREEIEKFLNSKCWRRMP